MSRCVNCHIQVARTATKPQLKCKDFFHYLANNTGHQRHRGSRIPSCSVHPKGWGREIFCLPQYNKRHLQLNSRLCFCDFPLPAEGSHKSVRVYCLYTGILSLKIGRGWTIGHNEWDLSTPVLLALPAIRPPWVKLFPPPQQIFWFKHFLPNSRETEKTVGFPKPWKAVLSCGGITEGQMQWRRLIDLERTIRCNWVRVCRCRLCFLNKRT